jgi:hypothetical protein
MRSQEQEMMECNNYNGDQLYLGGRRREDNSFLEKKITFCFNRQHNPNANVRSWGVGSSKDFEIHGVLKKKPRSARCTSYQADRNGYLPEIKIESPE